MIAFITGLPGTGKSTIGKMLADHLGWQFFDMDDAIPDDLKKYNREQKAIPQHLFDAYMPAFWSEVETRAVTGNIVVACTLARDEYVSELMQRFPHSIPLYLRADLDTLVRRLEQREHFFGAKVLKEIYATDLDVIPPFPVVDATAPLEIVFSHCLQALTPHP